MTNGKKYYFIWFSHFAFDSIEPAFTKHHNNNSSDQRREEKKNSLIKTLNSKLGYDTIENKNISQNLWTFYKTVYTKHIENKRDTNRSARKSKQVNGVFVFSVASCVRLQVDFSLLPSIILFNGVLVVSYIFIFFFHFILGNYEFHNIPYVLRCNELLKIINWHIIQLN